MTYEEAIDYGTSCIDAWESWVKPDAVQMQFYKLAIEAIAKQVPKKPRIREIDKHKFYNCPVCDGFLLLTTDGELREGQKRMGCSLCLQAIDWSDTDKDG